MFLTGHILSPNNTGNPDYNICGQGSSIVDFSNLNFKIGISKNGSSQTVLINVNDLSAPGLIVPSTTNYGDYDIYFGGFGFGGSFDPLTGAFQIELNVYKAGTTTQVTWEKFNAHVEISKTGYQSFANTFELYNYDVGNEAGFGISGNKDFDIYLVNNTNNIDVNGNQTRAFSSLLALRRPFTNEVYFYNMVGTQGSIAYFNGVTGIGSGSSGIVCSEEDITITQTITLSNNQTCSSDKIVLSQKWIPEINLTSSCPQSCGDCVNDNADVTINYFLDYTNVTVVKLNNTQIFVTQYLDNNIAIDVYNYLGQVIQSFTRNINPSYATWILNPSFYLTPTQEIFVPSELGDNVIKLCNNYTTTLTPIDDPENPTIVNIYSCCKTLSLPTCHWWTVNKDTECNKYIFNNCSVLPVNITIQQLQDDGTFTDIITDQEVGALENFTIEFQSDGVYVIKVPSQTEGEFEYYTLPVFCDIQSCFLEMIKATICKDNTGKCTEEDFYDFNAFVINFHSFMMVLNSEMNFNYLYTTLTDEKITELGVISDYITRLKEYCASASNKCLPCSNASS